MSDIITRLLLKTNDFDANLEKSKQSVGSFQSGITNMASTAGTSIMKFAGTLGVAVGAADGLKKVIDSSQTTGDAYVKMMDQAKASVDSFFASIALGNFDGFLSNLQNVIDKAGDLSGALDNLGTKTLFNNAEVDDLNTKYQIEINAAKARNISDKERNKHLAKAREYLVQMAGLQGSLATANTDTSYTALQAEISKLGFNHNVSREMWDYLIKDSKRSDIEKTVSGHKGRIFEYNKRIGSSRVKDDATEQMVDTDETRKIRDELKKYKESRLGLYGELNKLFIEAQDDENSTISQALKMRKTANSLKVAVSNRNLEVANVDSKINGSYNKKNGGGNGGGANAIEVDKGSIAWYDSEIAKLNKKLINTTDEQARAAIQGTISEYESKKLGLQVELSGNSIDSINIQLSALNKKLTSETDMQMRGTIQATINELEQRKINLKFVVDQEAFKIAHGAMKDGALPMPIKPTYDDKVPTHGKGGKNFKLPKYTLPFGEKDIKANQDFADSLGSISNAFTSLGAISEQFGNNGLAFVLNSMGSIGQMILQLESLAMAKGVSSAFELPFPANLAAVGIVVGTIASTFASIPKFATGGIVPGVSFTGDKVPALLNSGEMILNGSQQSNLFKLLNSRLYGSLAEKVNPLYGINGEKLPNSIRLDERDSKVEVFGNIKVRGCDLYLALGNYEKRTNRTR